MRQIYSLRLLLVVVYLIVVVKAYTIDFSRKLTKPDQQLESNKKLWIPRKSTVLHARKVKDSNYLCFFEFLINFLLTANPCACE